MRLIPTLLIAHAALAASTAAAQSCPSRVLGGYAKEIELTDVKGAVVARLKTGKQGVLATPLRIIACESTTYLVDYGGQAMFLTRRSVMAEGEIAHLKICSERYAGSREGRGSAAESNAIEKCP